MTELTLTGGRIWTGMRSRPGSLTIKDGLIAAVEFAPSTSGGTTVDIGGAVIFPGFADGHAHPVLGGSESTFAPVRNATSVEGVIRAVSAWAEDHPKAAWVQGWGYNPTLAPQGCFDAKWLDEAVSERPVALRAEDYHTVWCNSIGLELAGIDRFTPDPPRGRIVRHADGRPLGTLREWGAVNMVLDRMAPPSHDERRKALSRGLEMLAKSGVTWVQDAWVDPADVDLYVAAAQNGELAIRVNLALRVEPERWRDQVQAFLQTRSRVAELGSPLLTCRTAKFFIDGCIELGTADLLAPYLDAGGDTGIAMWETEQLKQAATAFDAEGFQLHIHAIGDRGVRNALDAIAAARQTNGLRDRRPVIAHAQLVDPPDVLRFAELDVIANFQPSWAQPSEVQTKLIVPRLGRKRADLQYPVQSMLDAGARVTFGSDWPCGPHPALEGLRTVTTRSAKGSIESWVPNERVELVQAIDCYTTAVAFQAFAEREWGSVEVGRAADLVVLSSDPAAVEPDEVGEIQVLGTWVAGRMAHGERWFREIDNRCSEERDD